MGLWKCTKCGVVTSTINKPLTGVCNKGGGHRWTSYNSNTPKLWYCAKCGVVTATANRPNDGVCTKGGRHTWRVRN